MKRITKKIVCLLTVATMLLVATVTVVGAVSTPDTVVDGQEYPFKSYCINKTTGDLKNTEMVYSNENYDIVTEFYNKMEEIMNSEQQVVPILTSLQQRKLNLQRTALLEFTTIT